MTRRLALLIAAATAIAALQSVLPTYDHSAHADLIALADHAVAVVRGSIAEIGPGDEGTIRIALADTTTYGPGDDQVTEFEISGTWSDDLGPRSRRSSARY